MLREVALWASARRNPAAVSGSRRPPPPRCGPRAGLRWEPTARPPWHPGRANSPGDRSVTTRFSARARGSRARPEDAW